jgi:hypothetical protein
MKQSQRKRPLSTNRNRKYTMKNYNTYTDEDYNSGDGFLTSVWGPAIWHFLHIISFNYPVHPTQEDKKRYRDFIISLRVVLPCKYCRINLDKNFKNLPLTMDDMKNRHSFSLYVYKLHEEINTMLNKKSGLTYEDVRERYEHFRARGCSTPKSKSRKLKKEKGCTQPLHGKKSKCIIKIVPQDAKIETFQLDKKCIKKRINDV